VTDACYRSAKTRAWEPVELDWRGAPPRISREPETYEGSTIIKSELLPDGRRKLILKTPPPATSSTAWSPAGAAVLVRELHHRQGTCQNLSTAS